MVARPLEVLVFGTGAVGSVFGWRAAQSGSVRVSVICRSNYDTVKREGIRFTTNVWGSGVLKPDRVARNPLELKGVGAFDYVVCANKFIPHEARSIGESLRPVVGPNTSLMVTQNGVGVEQPLRDVYPRNTLLSSICYVNCIQTSPGVVEQVAQIRPEAFHMGVYGKGQTDANLDKSRLQTLVGLDSKFAAIENVVAERWGKIMFNGAWSPASALFGLDTHQLLNESPAGLALVRQLGREINQVAVLSGAWPREDLNDRVILPIALAPPIQTSMLQDARNRRQMEVEPMCGTLCRVADSLGIQVPTVKATYQALLRMNESFLEDPHPSEPQKIGFLEGLRYVGSTAMPVAAF